MTWFVVWFARGLWGLLLLVWFVLLGQFLWRMLGTTNGEVSKTNGPENKDL